MTTSTAMSQDLYRSGLTQSSIRKMGTLYVGNTKKSKLNIESITNGQFFDVDAYQIPYFDITGKKTDFFRLRFLAPPKRNGFFKNSDSKPLRYWQPACTKPMLYYPPLLKWTEIAKRTDVDLYITEGEKKASSACQFGFPCIGLGGVWSWRSKALKEPVLKEFKQIAWKGRRVILCFDSDAKTNSHVMHALSAFSSALLDMGALIFTVELENEDAASKVGLDDFLVAHGAVEFTKLKQIPFEKSRYLWELNSEVAYIESLGGVCNLKNPTTIYRNHSQLTNLAFANRTYQLYNDNAEKFETVNCMKQWLKWPYRRTHTAINYVPGEEQVTQNNELNIWKGWGIDQFNEGTCKPFFELLTFVFGTEVVAREWFLDWLAYPIQNPGAKMGSAVLLWSRAQGTGKTFIGYIMGDIYGSNFIEISEDQLHDSYNEWLLGKQFILGAEITGTDKRRDADRIKNLITQEKFTVRAKYQPTYTVQDCANYLLTSNHPDSMFIERTDRRVLVHEIPTLPRERKFYSSVNAWRQRGGPGALAYYLLHRDLKKFDPHAPPPNTKAKEEMNELSCNDVDILIDSIIKAPDKYLVMGNVKIERDLFTLDDLIHFLPEDVKYISRIGLSKALRRAGLRRRIICTAQGTQKLWPLRNAEAWYKKEHHVWALHYNTGQKVQATSKPKRKKFKK